MHHLYLTPIPILISILTSTKTAFDAEAKLTSFTIALNSIAWRCKQTIEQIHFEAWY